MGFIIYILLRVIDIYSLILIAYALLSWVPSLYETSVGKLIIRLVRPILQPLYRLDLRLLGIDFTVWIAIIVLNLMSRLLIQFLYTFQ